MRLTDPDYRLGGYHEFSPPADLARYLDLAWRYARPVGAPGIPGRGHRVLPEPAVSLCFQCRRDSRGRVLDHRLVLMGPIRRTRFFAPGPGLHLEAVRLKPEWTAPLLGALPFEHADAMNDYALAAGRRAAGRLTGALVSTRSSGEALGLLLGWIRERVAAASSARFRSVARVSVGLQLVRSARTATLDVAAVAREACLSERHFRRLARQLTGDSPKHHHRLARLGAAVTAADRCAEPDWAALAVRLGFYDQPHLIREFRDLAGVTPVQAHRERALQGSRGSPA